jgi:hypothetical protein
MKAKAVFTRGSRDAGERREREIMKLKGRGLMLAGAVAAGLILLPGCERRADQGADDARWAEREGRFAPGLHTLMVDLSVRHASLWFAGEEGNWPLARYMVDELHKLLEDIEELHPVYREVPVAQLLGEMTKPQVESLDVAIDNGDHPAFVDAYDRLTAACNACHAASGREYIVMQRPSMPALTNLRY